MVRLCIVFAGVILLYDAIAGAASRLLWVTYEALLLPGAILLIAMGVYAGRTMKSWRAMVPIVTAALMQSTLGCYIGARISTSFLVAQTTYSLVFTIVVSAILGTAIGAAGVWIGLGVAGTRPKFL